MPLSPVKVLSVHDGGKKAAITLYCVVLGLREGL